MTIEKTPILRIALPTPLRRHFDYLAPEHPEWKGLEQGVRIKVPFRRRELIGMLIGYATETDVPLQKLKRAIEVLDTYPVVSKEIYQLCSWAADYYHYSLGEVLANAQPILLRQGRLLRSNKKNSN